MHPALHHLQLPYSRPWKNGSKLAALECTLSVKFVCVLHSWGASVIDKLKQPHHNDNRYMT